MAEFIEREKALEECDWYANEFCECEYAIMPLKGALENIQAADVRPVVRGKWTLNKDGSGTCSECGFVQNSCWDLDNWDNFCHHCGADMR